MFRKKSFATFMVVASLLLAACGGDDDNASPIPGGGAGGDAPEGEPIVIGLDEDSTSAGAAYSMVTAQAVRDTVDKVNSEGGVLDRPLEVVVGNSESDPTKGSAVARSLTEQGAVAIFLTAGSAASIQMKPLLQSEEVVGIAPTATSADLVAQPDADYVYTLAPSAAAWAPTYCGAFEAAGVESVGVLVENSPSLEALNEALITNGISECVEVVAKESAAPDSTDVTAQITKLKNAEPDAILSSTSGGSFEVLIQNTLDQVASDIPKFTVQAIANQPEEWRTANAGALEGLVGLASVDLTNERTKEAIEFFKSIRGEDFEVTGFDLQAYDAVYLLVEAIEAAGTVDGAAIKDAMNAIDDYEPHFGAEGFRLTFDEEKHNAATGDCGIVLAEFTADNKLGEPWATFQPSC
jgi:branched-chain amino acid transport system substrate-binding protein